MTAAEFRELRGRFGMSRRGLAGALACSYRSVESWELGKPIPGPVERLMMLAWYVTNGADVADLFSGSVSAFREF